MEKAAIYILTFWFLLKSSLGRRNNIYIFNNLIVPAKAGASKEISIQLAECANSHLLQIESYVILSTPNFKQVDFVLCAIYYHLDLSWKYTVLGGGEGE